MYVKITCSSNVAFGRMGKGSPLTYLWLGKISDLVGDQIYSRKPKFPLAVSELIFEIAIKYSTEDPSVGNIREWYNPWTKQMITIGRRWTLSSQKELASELLTLFKDKFAAAISSVSSESTVLNVSKIPSERYVAHVLHKFTWLSTSKQYYGTFFGCGWCIEWEENIKEFRNLVLELSKNCKGFCCYESLPC